MKSSSAMDFKQTKLFSSQDIDEKVLIYNIRIVPPEPLYSQVLKFKEEFVEVYGEHMLTKSTPHITLAKFKMSSSYQNYLVEYFEALNTFKKFRLEASGFNIFEGSNTLILKVNATQVLETLLVTIGNLKRALLYHKAKNFGLIYTPHLTIASMVEPETLRASLKHFKNIAYSKQPFEVDHLMITSRENGKTWDWEHRINLS